MKMRNGFVSNSSSSSFIIAKAYLNDKQIEGLRDGLSKVVVDGADPDDDQDDIGWGERGGTWRENGNYFIIETYYVYGDINDLFGKLNINWKDGCSIEG